MNLKFEMTPNRRIFLAFMLGTVQAGICYAFLMDWHGQEVYIKMMQDSWVVMHWGWWVPIWILLLGVYAWNIRNFDKETLWMTIKNPAKVTREEGTDMFGQPKVHPLYPPPPGSRPPPPAPRNISVKI